MGRFVVGIDLGTTNVAVAYLDLQHEEPEPQLFRIPQVIAAGELDSTDTLPSFLYIPNEGQYSPGSLDLPWAQERTFSVGTHARQQGARSPSQVVSSAKSWLCADSVDRLSEILPWDRPESQLKISPVEAAKRLLLHLRDAWNAQAESDDDRLEFQEIVLTVPASFDAVARDLTVMAADEAGLQVTLLEEPQAAFYAWIHEHEQNWRSLVSAGESVLVCDIGGGTTDFSLIQVSDNDGNLELERVAVGNHILLGGDNLDLTLAYSVAARLQREQNTKLSSHQLAGLTHACREAKERLLAENAEPQTLTVLGRGSSLIGNTISVEVTPEEARQVLLEGFFPSCSLDARPQESRRAGLRSFGLEYASDPAMTRHLAGFVARNLNDGKPPHAVLFNGGVSKAPGVRRRVLDILSSWQGTPVNELTGTHPDLAVALGACWYGNVRRGNSIRIRAGSPRSYYVGIESTMPAIPGFEPPLDALCVVPFGMEEGDAQDIPSSGLGVLVGTSSEFRFFASADRKDDQAGALIPDVADSEDLVELPALTTHLAVEEGESTGTLIPVGLHVELSEIGTLALWCTEEGGEGRWRLRYELRELDQTAE